MPSAKKKSPKNYARIARTKITRPSKVQRSPRLLIYGRNKKGKTTFGISAGVDQTLVLDPEGGTNVMVASDPHIWPIESWEDIDEAYQFLRHHEHPYRWVCVDGLTRLNNMALRYVMRLAEERDLTRRPGIVDRRDYFKSGELMKAMLQNFYNLQAGVIFTAQERQQGGDDVEDEEEGGAVYVPDLPRGVKSTVTALVDVVGRIYTTSVKVKRNGKVQKVTQRRLWIAPHERYDTGYRSDYVMPDYVVKPTIPKLVRLIKEGE